MKFKIVFSYPDDNWYNVVRMKDATGISVLDKTRKVFGAPQFPAEKVKLPCDLRGGNHSVQIHESVARASGHFQETDYIKVVVPEEFLNKYAVLVKDEYCYQNIDGGYDYLRLAWVIDDEQLLSDWINANYPLNWTEEEE